MKREAYLGAEARFRGAFMRPEAEASGYLEAAAKARTEADSQRNDRKKSKGENQYRGPSLRSRMTSFMGDEMRFR